MSYANMDHTFVSSTAAAILTAMQAATDQWCNPASDSSCTNCGIPLCTTGISPQPLGYGPPDALEVSVSGSSETSCYDINPKGYRRHNLGNDYVECGSATRQMKFVGSTNKEIETGRLEYYPGFNTFRCKDGKEFRASGSVDFDYTCTHDSGFNATCTAEDVEIPMTEWWWV
ncbi:hypothetical protein AJ79_07105 [Helicocarpus griseus UAMH5409]|uniref:Uncharacterized protein n=1 Tax=Helicocarpus griseus UAMH5409 TaxID=1447875 RepID=A0A2B7X5V3_9EURO|nr:hypothetical protein AJ79_07105 [Helicocarpus griseus UAMH5409]